VPPERTGAVTMEQALAAAMEGAGGAGGAGAGAGSFSAKAATAAPAGHRRHAGSAADSAAGSAAGQTSASASAPPTGLDRAASRWTVPPKAYIGDTDRPVSAWHVSGGGAGGAGAASHCLPAAAASRSPCAAASGLPNSHPHPPVARCFKLRTASALPVSRCAPWRLIVLHQPCAR
jgi:hypothetical protein